jgi:hypothetical protein
MPPITYSAPANSILLKPEHQQNSFSLSDIFLLFALTQIWSKNKKISSTFQRAESATFIVPTPYFKINYL